MSLDSQCKLKKIDDSYILYDDSIIAEPSLQLFDVDYHTNSGLQQNKSPAGEEGGIGRAQVKYFQYQDVPLVLKHYYRGGLVARFVRDRYLAVSLENSRAFREFRLLQLMKTRGLPVPDAVAARVQKNMFCYRADLITREIKSARTLADTLAAQPADTEVWNKIGGIIRTFHNNDIYHADLNARNILLTERGEVYLIDFDNSRVRSGSDTWKTANLARLHRSLMKFKNSVDSFAFDQQDWASLVSGYAERSIGN